MPQPSLPPLVPGPFIELQSVDSTNNYARELIRTARLTERQGTGLHLSAVFAHEQVAGKGQRGKSWVSEKDTSLSLSLIIENIPLPLSQQFALSASMALAARDFLAEIAGDDCRIKWPNDLYWQDRKAGGMLIESGIRSSEPGAGSREPGAGSSESPSAVSGIPTDSDEPGQNPLNPTDASGSDEAPCSVQREACSDPSNSASSQQLTASNPSDPSRFQTAPAPPFGESENFNDQEVSGGRQQPTASSLLWSWSIIGLGLNINQPSFPPDLPNPVSLRQITGKVKDPLELARGLHTRLVEAYAVLLREGFEPVLERYNQCLYKWGERVRFRKNGIELQATVLGVSPAGQLRVFTEKEEEWGWGEVEWNL